MKEIPGQYGAKRPVGRTKHMVLARHLKGWSVKRIARDLGVTRQAVGQHLARLRADGNLPEKKAS